MFWEHLHEGAPIWDWDCRVGMEDPVNHIGCDVDMGAVVVERV
jgi:hypothetical protein